MKTLLWIALLLFSVLQDPGRDQAGPATRPDQKESDRRKIQKLLEAAGEVRLQVEELRGWEFKKEVKTGVHSEAELRRFIEKALFEEEMAGNKLPHAQYMLQSLGFIPLGTDLKKTFMDVLLNQVGGFYDPKRKTFYMMQRTARFGEFLTRMLMAHELTHALDDQHFGLDQLMKRMGGTEDGDFSIGSVVEGSATVLMMRWTQMNRSSFDLSELKKAMEAEAKRTVAFFKAPPYFRTLLARYLMGMFFLTRGKGPMVLLRSTEGIAEDLERAFVKPPRSSEQVLHPEKYWDPQKKDEPVLLADEDAFVAALEKETGLMVLDRDTIGELLCSLLGKKHKTKVSAKDVQTQSALMMSPRYWTHKSGQGWGGDRLFLLGRKVGRIEDLQAILWLTWWDGEKDAGEFAQHYARRAGRDRSYGSRTEGRLAVFAFGDLEDKVESLLPFVMEKGPVTKDGVAFPLKD